MLQNLPVNLQYVLYSALSFEDLERLSLTSSYFRNFFNHPDNLSQLLSLKKHALQGFSLKSNHLSILTYLEKKRDRALQGPAQAIQERRIPLSLVYFSSTDFDQHVDRTYDLTDSFWSSMGHHKLGNQETLIFSFEKMMLPQAIFIKFYHAEYLLQKFYYPTTIRLSFYLNSDQEVYSKTLDFPVNYEDSLQARSLVFEYKLEDNIMAKFVKYYFNSRVEFLDKTCVQETDNQYYIAVQSLFIEGQPIGSIEKYLQNHLEDNTQQLAGYLQNIVQKPTLHEVITECNQHFELIDDKRVIRYVIKKGWFKTYCQNILLLQRREFLNQHEIYYYLKDSLDEKIVYDIIVKEGDKTNKLFNYFKFLDTFQSCVVNRAFFQKVVKLFFKIIKKTKVNQEEKTSLQLFLDSFLMLRDKTVFVYNYHLRKTLAMVLVQLNEFLKA